MIDVLLEMYLEQHPGRGSYAPTECRIFEKALQNQPYQMNTHGRHPFNIITEEIYNVDN